ncbi:MAG: hypothetical protein A2Y21_01695 [Clostridiales bacterium GWC2_40_7]|nr:MAG: hypothetical protein A2Y21_01695 [Clostridiales bacterium GWC2_40_7]
MRNKKSPWILLLLILAGALIGGIAGGILAQYPSLAWISLGGANGYRELIAFSMNPLVDTHVIRLGFEFALRVNAGSLLGMILGIILYTRM